MLELHCVPTCRPVKTAEAARCLLVYNGCLSNSDVLVTGCAMVAHNIGNSLNSEVAGSRYFA